MSRIDKIKNYFFPTPDNQRLQDPKQLDKYITKVQLLRIRQDVKTWREGVMEAEQAYYPHRVKMQRTFQDTTLNGHVFACMEKRKRLTLLKDFRLENEAGVIDEYWSEQFRKQWITDIMNYSLDALFYGYNLINFDGIENDELTNITVIKRHNISPDREQIVSYVYSLSGLDINSEDVNPWVIWVKTPTENGVSNCGYGLLYRVGVYEVMLRNLLAYNADFVEKFSQPFRYAKTHKTQEIERGELEEMLRDLGSSGYGIFDPQDEIGFLESANSGTGFLGYDNFEKRCEAKISKIILGHADAMDSTPGKLGGNDESNEALEDIEIQDGRFIEHVFNAQLLPKLRLHGINIPEGLKFKFSNDKEKLESRKKEDENNAITAAIFQTIKNAGGTPDWAYFTERTGIPVEKTEEPAPEPLNMDIKNKLNDLYGRI